MKYLLDTVAVIRFFTGGGRIGTKAKSILRDQSNHFFVSAVSIMEILRLSEKKRISLTPKRAVNDISNRKNYEIIDLSPEIIIEVESVEFYEMHDRMILATAKFHDLPVISSDSKFTDVKGITTIWK